MVLRMNPFEHATRRAQNNWVGFIFPQGVKYLSRPWHKSDDDSYFRKKPRVKVPNSDQIIDHLVRTGTFRYKTGSVTPDYDGKVGGVLLNEARATDPVFTISRTNGRRNLCVTTGYRSPYGAKVRIGDHMAPQGYPMHEYSDHKVHIYDPIDNTITEIQFIVDVRKNPFLNWFLSLFGRGGGYQCHGVKQYSLDDPSTMASGSTASNFPNAEPTIRYDDVLDGRLTISTIAVTQAHATEFVWPATNSDGVSHDNNAIRMGQILKLKNERFEVISSDPQTGEQALHIARCLNEHGMMVVDTGGNQGSGPEPDVRWDQADLQALVSKISLDDFEVWIW